MRAFLSLALTVAVFPLSGTERWSTPVLGAVFDSEGRAIRPVLGVAGAAGLADAVPIPDKIERAFAAPDGAYAVVTGAEGTAVVSWTGGDVRSVRLDDAVVPAGVSWSGDTFAIYSADGVVQIWRDGKLTETRSTEPGTEVSLCADGRLALGVCGRDGDYSIDTSGLMRTRDGKRELIAEGVFKAVAAHAGFIVAAGSELLVWHGADARRLALPTIAVAVQPMRTPGVFAVALDDGSLWVYSDGELQLMQGGRR